MRDQDTNARQQADDAIRAGGAEPIRLQNCGRFHTDDGYAAGCPHEPAPNAACDLTTTELRRQRKIRRTVRRFRQDHPHETRPDSLRTGVDFLASLRCDDSTTRQGRLPT